MNRPRDGALKHRREEQRDERRGDVNAARDLQRPRAADGHLAQIGTDGDACRRARR